MEKLIFFSLEAPEAVSGCVCVWGAIVKLSTGIFHSKRRGRREVRLSLSPQAFPQEGLPPAAPLPAAAAQAQAGADSEQKLRPNFAKLSETLPPPPPSSPRPSPPAPPAATALRGAPLSAEGMAAVPPSAAPPPRPLRAEVRGAPGGRPPPLRQSFGIGVSS